MERMVGWKGVLQLDSYGAEKALLLVEDRGSLGLRAVDLP